MLKIKPRTHHVKVEMFGKIIDEFSVNGCRFIGDARIKAENEFYRRRGLSESDKYISRLVSYNISPPDSEESIIFETIIRDIDWSTFEKCKEVYETYFKKYMSGIVVPTRKVKKYEKCVERKLKKLGINKDFYDVVFADIMEEEDSRIPRDYD